MYMYLLYVYVFMFTTIEACGHRSEHEHDGAARLVPRAHAAAPRLGYMLIAEEWLLVLQLVVGAGSYLLLARGVAAEVCELLGIHVFSLQRRAPQQAKALHRRESAPSTSNRPR